MKNSWADIGRYGQFMLVALATLIVCVASEAGSIEGRNIVGFNTGPQGVINDFMIKDTGGLPLEINGPFCYVLQDGCAMIVGYTGTNSTLLVPAEIEGKPVKIAGAIASSVIERITVSDASEAYKAVDGVLFTRDGATLIQYPRRSQRTHYTIPDSVTRIMDNAFLDCATIASITIPASVTAIGDKAFAGCIGLNAITIPTSVTFIGAGAFSGCAGLAGVNFDGYAPHFDAKRSLFWNVDRVSVYHGPGTKDWGAIFNGRPTTSWTEPVE